MLSRPERRNKELAPLRYEYIIFVISDDVCDERHTFEIFFTFVKVVILGRSTYDIPWPGSHCLAPKIPSVRYTYLTVFVRSYDAEVNFAAPW
jgi:hypothetical protein